MMKPLLMVISVIHPSLASTKIEAFRTEHNYTEEKVIIDNYSAEGNMISRTVEDIEGDKDLNHDSPRRLIVSKLEGLTVEQLKIFAKENNIEIKSNMNKADIIKSIVELQS